MNQLQHMKLFRHYQKRYAEMAAYSRSVHGKLTRQQAQDYADMFRKYLDHKKAALPFRVGALVFWLKTSYTGDYKVRGEITKMNAKTATIRVHHAYSGKYTLHNVRFENLQTRTEDENAYG